MSSCRIRLIGLSLVLLTACSPSSEPEVGVDAPQVTVYSARADYLIKPLFDRFTEQTGIAVRYTTDTEAALIARIQAEGESSPADVLLTVDAGNLWYADSLGAFQPIASEILERNVPAHLRSANDTWFGLSVRARTLVYSTERVNPQNLSSYEGLADPQWRGRLCLRTSKKVYNQSLVASLMTRLGAEATEQVVRGWADNLALEPLASDNQAIEAIVAGACDVAVVNTYYFGRMEADNPDIPVAIFWPNQDSSGVHINVSGAGVVRTAPHPQLAQQLIEWLSQPEAQHLFAGLNREFPVNPQVQAVPEVQAWGAFTADELEVERLGQLQSEAVMLMDRAGYR